MDMEELTKSQIVLLTLFVSFITSIATGIVTVALMNQAPPVIAQTVNRIVQQTVEKVVPASQQAGTGKTVVTEQTTVVIKESELISQAVERVAPSIVRLYSGPKDAPLFLGFGIVLDAEGMIVTDSDSLGESAEATIVIANGSSTRAFVRQRDSKSGLAYLLVATSSTSQPLSFSSATLAAEHPVLGQSIVGLYGKSVLRIAAGLVIALVQVGEGRTQLVIETDIPVASIAPGSPIINTDGAVVGISTGVSRASSLSGFVSASALFKQAPQSAGSDN
ncbi:MAG TPA: serine protease [Candidatus Paceibacterota bacterium]